jgi:hypothetical protein
MPFTTELRTSTIFPPLVALLLSCGSKTSSVSGPDSTADSGVAGGGAPASGQNSGGGRAQAEAGQAASQGGDDEVLPTSSAGASAAESCIVSGPEECNGSDDDCNGVVDDGCPKAVSILIGDDLPALGESQGGDRFADDCPDGSVLGGLQLGMGAFLYQVRGLCRSISVAAKSGAASDYQLSLNDAEVLAPHPSDAESVQASLACPAGEAVVGLHISQQKYAFSGNDVRPVIHAVWLTCAKAQLVNVKGVLGAEWLAPHQLAPVVGSTTNGTESDAAAVAPEGSVATRFTGASGAWVDRVSIGVGRVQISDP